MLFIKKNVLLIITFIAILSFTKTQEADIEFSKDSGFYSEEFELTLTASGSSKIYYTVDSSNPINSTTTKEYSGPIKIVDRTSEPNIYSDIAEDESSPVSISRGNNFKKPVYLVDKPMVVRAVSKNDKGEFGKICDKTYFITNGDLKQY